MPGPPPEPSRHHKIAPLEFEALVKRAVESLPQKYLAFLTDVTVTVEDEPDQETLRELELESEDDLLGLYTGTSEGKESFFDSAGHLPAKITIYRGPILRLCSTADEIVEEVRDTVVHEIGHHFGLSDEEMPY